MDLNLLRDTPPWEWPTNAGATFKKILVDRSASTADRQSAAELAGDFTVINDDLAAALLTVLRDASEPDELRAAAAVSFGAALDTGYTEYDESLQGFEDEEMVPISSATYLEIGKSLKALYADTSIPKLVRRRILEASVRAQASWQVEAVGKAYTSGDRDWVVTAVFCMQFVHGFEKEILESLDNPDEEIHFEAVRAAGESELDAAWPHVSELAQDESTPKDLRIVAIAAAGQIRPREAQGFLFELSDSTDEDIAEAADEALSFIGEDLDEDDEFDEDEDFEDDDDEEEAEE